MIVIILPILFMYSSIHAANESNEEEYDDSEIENLKNYMQTL